MLWGYWQSKWCSVVQQGASGERGRDRIPSGVIVLHISGEGGYVPSNLGIDTLIVGFYRGADLLYAARVRAGFIPRTRSEVLEQLKHLDTPGCPFANLPEVAAG